MNNCFICCLSTVPEYRLHSSGILINESFFLKMIVTFLGGNLQAVSHKLHGCGNLLSIFNVFLLFGREKESKFQQLRFLEQD